MQFFNALQVLLQWLYELAWKNGDAVLAAFAVAHQYLSIAEIEVFDA